ncbi:MAG: hypothetical protein DSY90_10180 [Deltaproteobacteria bacterium]|nr:MAG: hypothetical protein DSY90_10180 [Deltaproteobacteria bacterium]
MKKNKPDLKSDNTQPELNNGYSQQKAQTSQKIKKSHKLFSIEDTTMGEVAEREQNGKNRVAGKLEQPGKNIEKKTFKKEKKKKKKEKNKRKKKYLPKKIGCAKGIETMFKTSYRAQLDMISLGATKAKIMISINGLLVTVLTVSGVFIYTSEPLFLAPTAVFMATAAISIFFAIQAASPGHYNKDVKLKGSSSREKFSRVNTNFLNYEYYAELSKKDYVKGMKRTLQDPEKVYLGMIDYLYSLGVIANWNFKMLRYSYLVFRVGVVSGIVMLVAIQIYVKLTPKPHEQSTAMVTNQLAQFDDIYKPSGVEALPDGRLLIIEGDRQRALSVVELMGNGAIKENSMLNVILLSTLNIRLEDLEAVTIDKEGYIYAITSFRRAANGRRVPAKERLVRFKIENNRVTAPKSYNKLGDYLESIGISDGHTNLCIEGLTFDPAGKRLLVGFRQPVFDGKAIIMVIENPQEIFEGNAALKIRDKPVLLDLDGAGILSISYDPYLQGYLISSELNGKNNKNHSQLWFWNGKFQTLPRQAMLPAMIDVKNIEGMSHVKIAGKELLMLVSGDGNRKRHEPAHYMLLQYNQLIFN